MAEAKNAATINRLMSKRPSVLYLPKSTLFSRVKGHKGSPVLPRLLPSIVMGSLLRRAHFESLIAAEAKNSATINQLKYRSRSCITENIALGAWSRANKALGCASCFIGSRPRPRAIFPVMHSHGTLTSMYKMPLYLGSQYASEQYEDSVSQTLYTCTHIHVHRGYNYMYMTVHAVATASYYNKYTCTLSIHQVSSLLSPASEGGAWERGYSSCPHLESNLH